MSLLEIRKLCFSYKNSPTPLLRDFELTLDRRERVCLAAPSGRGKTTLLRLIAGLEKPDSGEIRLGGRVAYLFQEDRLLPWLTAEENLTLIGASREQALTALESVGLDCADKLPRELSGGMRRRLAIARTICLGGEILLLDEPFSGLDPVSREKAATALDDKFRNAAVILITHIPEEAGILGARLENFDPTPEKMI